MNKKLANAVVDLNNDLAEIIKLVSSFDAEKYKLFSECLALEKARREKISNIYKKYDQMLKASLNSGAYESFDELKKERDELMGDESVEEVEMFFKANNFTKLGSLITHLNDLHFNLLDLVLNTNDLDKSEAIKR